MEKPENGGNSQEQEDKKVETPKDPIAEVAQAELAKIAEEQKEESKDASSDTPSEKEKIEDKKDEKDEEGSKPDDKEASKIEKIKEATQKRIDEITKEVYEERNKREQDFKLISVLETEIKQLRGQLEKGGVIETDSVRARKEVEGQWDKYVQEDADKPWAERREMTKEELEDFFVEDNVAAQEWLVERRFRRQQELDASIEKVKQEKEKAEEKPKEPEGDFNKQLTESRQKLLDKYPDLNIGDRRLELAKEIMEPEDFAKVNTSDASLTREQLAEKYEIVRKYGEQIDGTIRKENKTFDEMMKIIESDPDKYTKSATSPELVMEEMEKRLSSDEDEKETYTKEDLEKARKEAAEAEQERIRSIDNGNPPSGPKGSKKTVKNSFSESPNYQKGLDEFLKAGQKRGKKWTEQDYIEILEYRQKIPGANKLDEEDAAKAGVT